MSPSIGAWRCAARPAARGSSRPCRTPPGGRRSGRRVHAMATYLKTFQALSYERLQSAFADLFGLRLSQGGLMNLLRRGW